MLQTSLEPLRSNEPESSLVSFHHRTSWRLCIAWAPSFPCSYIPGTQEEVIEVAGGEKNVKYFMLAGAFIY